MLHPVDLDVSTIPLRAFLSGTNMPQRELAKKFFWLPKNNRRPLLFY
jgi:hypothetical protein